MKFQRMTVSIEPFDERGDVSRLKVVVQIDGDNREAEWMICNDHFNSIFDRAMHTARDIIKASVNEDKAAEG